MKLKISIPTNLSEIKLHQYQKFLKIVGENEESDFIKHKMMQIFCGVELNLVAKMRQKDVDDTSVVINGLFNKLPSLVQRFELNGKTFGFIPNLDEMTSGEYMDLDSYINNWEDMHRAMAVLYRPIKQMQGERYLIDDYEGSEKYSELMKDAPLNVCLGAVVFFWTLGKELLKSTMDYLAESPQMDIVNKHNLDNDGGGILQSTHLLKEMLGDLMTLQNYQLTSVLPS